ncbi:hypothetical protein DFH11DRAFT_1275113 [Phellopilus nigrolimitatus]|nr:hypothetical protein DFH11DRAFT_1275113 [Phellopilus nigrolimitatus]
MVSPDLYRVDFNVRKLRTIGKARGRMLPKANTQIHLQIWNNEALLSLAFLEKVNGSVNSHVPVFTCIIRPFSSRLRCFLRRPPRCRQRLSPDKERNKVLHCRSSTLGLRPVPSRNHHEEKRQKLTASSRTHPCCVRQRRGVFNMTIRDSQEYHICSKPYASSCTAAVYRFMLYILTFYGDPGCCKEASESIFVTRKAGEVCA